MRLRQGLTFDESIRLIKRAWENVNATDREIDSIDRNWKRIGNKEEVEDSSVCWLFCYADSGPRYDWHQQEILGGGGELGLWDQLFDDEFKYSRFLEFQTNMDGGRNPAAEERYLHRQRHRRYSFRRDRFFD